MIVLQQQSSRMLPLLLILLMKTVGTTWIYPRYIGEHPERHIAGNLRQAIEKCAGRWNLVGKIKATVHDNARNVTLAVRDSYQLGECVPCMHYRHSSLETAALAKKKKNRRNSVFLKFHKVEQSCKTPWNSTFKMLQRLVEQKSAICAILMNTTSSGNINMRLEESEWDEIKNLIEALKAFDVATTLMSSQTKVTLSMVPPLICRLKENFLQIIPTDCATIAKFKETVSKELQELFMDKTSVKNNEPTCALLAEILVTRYKNLAMKNEATEVSSLKN